MSRSTSIVSATALTVALLWNLPAQAQDASPAPAGTVAPPDAEITVTGTRIQRDGYQAPTPLTVLGAEDIEASAPANIADYVNDIHPLVGSVKPASPNPNSSAGTAEVNALHLRAIGPTRTTVLLRSEERRVGNEGVRRCSSRWAPN